MQNVEGTPCYSIGDPRTLDLRPGPSVPNRSTIYHHHLDAKEALQDARQATGDSGLQIIHHETIPQWATPPNQEAAPSSQHAGKLMLWGQGDENTEATTWDGVQEALVVSTDCKVGYAADIYTVRRAAAKAGKVLLSPEYMYANESWYKDLDQLTFVEVNHTDRTGRDWTRSCEGQLPQENQPDTRPQGGLAKEVYVTAFIHHADESGRQVIRWDTDIAILNASETWPENRFVINERSQVTPAQAAEFLQQACYIFPDDESNDSAIKEQQATLFYDDHYAHACCMLFERRWAAEQIGLHLAKRHLEDALSNYELDDIELRIVIDPRRGVSVDAHELTGNGAVGSIQGRH